jgi:hypothetical protein
MNKEPNNDSSRRVSIIDSDENVGKIPLDYMKCNLSNSGILDMVITSKECLDYNLRTEEMHPIGNWEVINSAATDIEILRAVVNVLTTVITSNQFLSVTRRFDAKINNERTIQTRLEEDARFVKNKVSATIDAVVNHPDYDLLQGLIGGINVDGLPLESFDDETTEPTDFDKDLPKI